MISKVVVVFSLFFISLSAHAETKYGPLYSKLPGQMCESWFANPDATEAFMMLIEKSRELPDIAVMGELPSLGTIERVGMENIEFPMYYQDAAGNVFPSHASVDAYVRLNQADEKGIHMSRLFLLADHFGKDIKSGTIPVRDVLTKGSLQRATEDNTQAIIDENLVLDPSLASVELPSGGSLMGSLVSLEKLDQVARQMLATHQRPGQVISDLSMIRLSFTMARQQPALITNNAGWRNYPIKLEVRIENGEPVYVVETAIDYSSTCPCSAALSRQALTQKLMMEIADKHGVETENINLKELQDLLLRPDIGSVATPHAQRSMAVIRLAFTDIKKVPDLFSLVSDLDYAVGAPTQTAVKREDEQAFAVLNGLHLGFVEDKMRVLTQVVSPDEMSRDYNNLLAERLGVAFDGIDGVDAFHIHLSHYESLHSHDAAAVNWGGNTDLFSHDRGNLVQGL